MKRESQEGIHVALPQQGISSEDASATRLLATYLLVFIYLVTLLSVKRES